jgi:hypothetical protein
MVILKVIFSENIKYHFVSDTEVANVDNLTKVIFKCQTNGMVQILSDNEFGLIVCQ